MKKFDLKDLVRQNIWNLKPYSCARDEFLGDKGVFFDANENPYGSKNRYPDPHQRELKKALSAIKCVPEKNIFIGNGSDEIIDLVYRIFCYPGKDNVIICPPTYGIYEVSAQINNVNIIRIPLTEDFQLNTEEILRSSAKCIFICSPNNPTGNCIHNIDKILDNFNGIVVIDEAYIDFSYSDGYLNKLSEYSNLIIMQTFSKAPALASARIGVAYSSEDITGLMDKTKPPYNVSTFNLKEALKVLSRPNKYRKRLDLIIEQRIFLKKELQQLPVVKHIYPSDANFLLVEVSDAEKIYQHLVSENIIVRNRNAVVQNCLRITVGKPKENKKLLIALHKLSG